MTFFKYILLLSFLCGEIAFAGSVDDLFKKVEKLKTETEKANLLAKELVLEINNGEIGNTKRILYKYYPLAISLGSSHKANLFLNLGLMYAYTNHQDTALVYLNKAKKLFSTLNETEGLSNVELNLGKLNLSSKDYTGALKHFFRAIDLKGKVNDQTGIAITFSNIAAVFKEQKKYEQALEYFLKALEIDRKMDNVKALSIVYNDVGTIYLNLGKYDKAIEYNVLSIELKIMLNDKAGLAESNNNLGMIYFLEKDFDKALQYSQKALEIEKSINESSPMSSTQITIGKIQLAQGLVEQALESFHNAVSFALKAKDDEMLYIAYKNLSIAYELVGDNTNAFHFYRKFIVVKDSFLGFETNKHIEELESKFKFNEQNKQIDLLQKEKEIQKTAHEKKQLFINSLAAGFLLICIIVVLMFNRSRVKQKAHEQLEKQHREIEEKNSLLGKKNKEILDSINYAKHIQNAILPDKKEIKISLPNSFVLYKPKDIVSGDFYWLSAPMKPAVPIVSSGNVVKSSASELVMFAVVDCTGHGVPGAFMSIVGNNGLNAAVNERYLTKPSSILDYLNRHVVKTLSQQSEDNQLRDGMDIALCTLRKSGEEIKLQFAGANNPIWVVTEKKELKITTPHTQYRTTDFKGIYLHEIRGNKHPIGRFLGDDLIPFTNHEIELYSNDCVYVFSDGYSDQFGGGDYKKFKQAKMKNLLAASFTLEISEQKEILDITIENWKGDHEQIDDICVIGVRL